jgi:hypothetical protein
MTKQTGMARARLAPPRRAAALVAALAGGALIVAACGGGGTHAARSAASPGLPIANALDTYASCMRSHGVPGFYFSRQVGTPSPPSPGQVVMDMHGWIVTVADTKQVQNAQQACQHLFPSTPPSAGQLHQQFLNALKAAACMRTHGYPDWPDPQDQGGRSWEPTPPAGVDTTSPQFQATAKACSVGPLGP